MHSIKVLPIFAADLIKVSVLKNKKNIKKTTTISFFVAMICFCSSIVSAQHQLTGIVKDGADGSSVPYATAVLLRADSSVVSGVMTDLDGKFVIENVATGNYLLQVSFLGYEKAYRNVNISSRSDVGEITLTESANRLNEVVVTATRPLVTMRADRYVVNVSGNIQSAGRNSLDILRNTPGLLVDQNGNITVMGKGIQVWVDGRPSQMSGEQLRAFLNSMQGGEIDRIEVVTNPSSRYEAEGSGGIIDIRTRKGLELGVNGTITAGYQQGETDRENAGVNMNWRREKFNIFGNYSFYTHKDYEIFRQTNVMQTSEGEIMLTQNVKTNSPKPVLGHTARVGMDYYINPNNIWGVVVNAYHSGGGSTTSEGGTDVSPVYNGVDYSTVNGRASRDRKGIQANMNYQSTFANKGQQLNVDLDYAHFYSDPFQQNANTYFGPDGAVVNFEQFRNTNPQNIDVYSAKIDYKQPLWKDAMIETGVKFGQSITDNDLKYDLFTTDEWHSDPARSNRFAYTEQVSAAFININQRLGKFSLQAGLRGEYTYSKGDQKTTGEVNDTTYFNLFPTFFVNYQASPMHNFGLSYSRRLSRPNFENLNPFKLILDDYFYRIGNPNLTPAYTHLIQLSHSYAQGLMTRIAYSNTTDQIIFTPVKEEDAQRTSMTYRNFGRSQNISMMINYRRQIAKIWTANLTVQGAYMINTSKETSNEFNNNGGMIMAQLNNNIAITPTLSAEVTGMYMSKVRQGYTVMQPQGILSAGLRQMLLKNKMSLSLNVNDILHTSIYKMYTRYDNVNNTVKDITDTRYVNLTLRYNFGSSTVKAARSKSTGIEDETTRAGGR